MNVLTENKADRNGTIPCEAYQRWIQTLEESSWKNLVDAYRETAERVDWPLISVVMATYNTPAIYLRDAIESVRSQSYPHWQLCITDDASSAVHVKDIVESHASGDARIVRVYRAENGGIAEATNDALTSVSGEYIAFMDHDDVLAQHALLAIALTLQARSKLKLIYSDSDRLGNTGKRCQPFFKPDWNYDLFLAQNYLNHLSVYRKSLLDDLGGLKTEFDGAQDYDLALRAVERLEAEEIGHIPRILYHWRVVESSVSRTNLGAAARAGRNAVRAHLLRCATPATVETVSGALIYNRIAWDLPAPLPAVAILVYGEDLELLAWSVRELRNSTNYRRLNIETICCAAGMNDLSRVVDAAARRQDADILCFVAAGFLPPANDWLDTLCAHAARPSVGAVGVKFIRNDNELACGPLVLGVADPRGGGKFGPAFDGAPKESKGDFARVLLEQQVSAVHGACFASRRDIFLQAGGLNAALASHAAIGIDYSLKVARLGYRAVWAAGVLFNCSNTLAASIFETEPSADEIELLKKDWPQSLSHDPYYNLNFAKDKASFTLPLVQEKCN